MLRPSFSTLRIVAFLSFVNSIGACRPDSPTKNPPTHEPEASGFPLTVPRDQWNASNYCGTTRPELPANPAPAYRFTNELLNSKLSGDGLTGWMHGVVPQYGHYIFTYRKEDPKDRWAFFKAEQFSLIPASAEIKATLETLNRHDKVVLKGHIFENQSPLKHIRVTGIEIIETFELATKNHYSFDPSKLAASGTERVFGIVHTATSSQEHGFALILEHRDFILPIAVPHSHQQAAAELYRGDIVEVAVKVVPPTNRPSHFELDHEAEDPIQMVDSILNCHGAEKTVTGHLAKFEKSPAISVDVYAIRVVDANGIARNFTLFPDTDDEDEFERIFFELSQKAKDAWDSSIHEPHVVRNFRDKVTVKITAKGWLNVVSSEQANAQIYMKSADDLTLTVEE